MSDYYYNGDGENDDKGDYANGYVDLNGMNWLTLSVVACVSFWCQSIVTEERSVHDNSVFIICILIRLNILCEKSEI